MTTTQFLEKIIPSPLERGLEKLSYSLVPLVPMRVKPNHLTWLGFIAGVSGAIAFYLASFYKGWFLVAAAAILAHLILDALDGAVARQRSLTSKSGYFLDLFLDCLAFVMIPLGVFFSTYDPLKIFVFNSIAYSLHSLLLLHWIHLRNKWIFPLIGPCEVHLIYIALAILTFFWSGDVITVNQYSLNWFSLSTLIGVPLTILELLWLAFKLLRELEIEQS